MFKYASLQLKCIKFYQLPGVNVKIFGAGGCRNHFRLHLVSVFTSSLELDFKLGQRGKHNSVLCMVLKIGIWHWHSYHLVDRDYGESVHLLLLGKQKLFVLYRFLKKQIFFWDQVFLILQYLKVITFLGKLLI